MHSSEYRVRHRKFRSGADSLLLLLLAVLSFAGCQKGLKDSDENEEEYYPVELLMGMKEFEQEGEQTKALPSGYTVFSPGATNPGKIGMFMTQQPAGSEYTYTSITGTYAWSTTDLKWNSNVSVKYDKSDPGGPSNKYYAYGFMPAGGSVGATITSSDFSAGAVMTLTNVPPVSAQDLCIVTGVLTGVPIDPEAKPLTYPSIESVNIKEGENLYVADTISNAIYLLLKHVYSKYSLKMGVDSAYNTMRTIKVTNMKLSADAPAMNVDVTYAHGSAPTVSITALSSTASLESEILSSETALGKDATDLASFYCASLLDYIQLSITFDVYDKGGTKLRSQCKTTNRIKVQNLEAGKHYTVTATIKPTYLYQLSEEDLDRPTVVI